MEIGIQSVPYRYWTPAFAGVAITLSVQKQNEPVKHVGRHPLTQLVSGR
jgi:hypothetical protein